MENSVDTAVLSGSTGAIDLTVVGLFLHADWIVKAFLLLLLLASIWSLAIIIEKIFRLRKLDGQASDFEDLFWSGGALEDLYDRVGVQPQDPMSAMFGAAMREWRRSAARGTATATQMRAGLQQRIERVMYVTLGREMDRLQRYMTVLPSVGSTPPLLGPFRTLLAILNTSPPPPPPQH